MNTNTLIILIIINYLLLLKIFFIIFKKKYYFPFRYADLFAFIFNLSIFSIISLQQNYKLLVLSIIINLNLFYIFFHLINMIVTSPRTKIIIDLLETKKKQFDLKNYLKKYNCRKIVDKRIERLISSRQIIIKKKLIFLNKKKNSFFRIVCFVFATLEKI